MSITRSTMFSLILAATTLGCYHGRDQATTPPPTPTQTASSGPDVGNGTDASGSALDPADARGGPTPTTPEAVPPNSINPTKPPPGTGAYPNGTTPIPTPPPTPMPNPMPTPSPSPYPSPPSPSPIP